jgi:dTDP-glucose pyrophosphorylase
MKGPVLVVLAAGMGSRYGGLKQMERIGKYGEVLLDYSVFDALRGGFKKFVFIIRRDIENEFREIVLSRMEGKADYDLAFQELDTLIPEAVYNDTVKIGRTKPWGTAHALACAADNICAPFAVLNADDFYGRESFAAIGQFLSTPGLRDGAIVPYRLDRTLSPQGTVARGVCEIRDNCLVTVEELTAIEKKDGIIFNTNSDGSRRELAADTPVSMNFFGFPDTALPHFRKYFDDFIAVSGREPKSECFLPKATDWLIKNKLLEVKALTADSEWFGVTYREDREAAVKRLETLTNQGCYPSPLWAK